MLKITLLGSDSKYITVMEMLNMLGKIAQTAIDKKSGELIQLATQIWENPEIAYQEVKASKWTAEMLEKEGFTVEKGYAGVLVDRKSSSPDCFRVWPLERSRYICPITCKM